MTGHVEETGYRKVVGKSIIVRRCRRLGPAPRYAYVK